MNKYRKIVLPVILAGISILFFSTKADTALLTLQRIGAVIPCGAPVPIPPCPGNYYILSVGFDTTENSTCDGGGGPNTGPITYIDAIINIAARLGATEIWQKNGRSYVICGRMQ